MSNLKLPLSTAIQPITSTFQYGDLQFTRADASALTMTSQPGNSVPLSRRQTEVLHLLVQGRSNKQIARDLGLAEGTVKIHVAALFHKLQVTSRTAAAVAGAKLLASTAAPPAPSSPASQVQTVAGSHPFGPAGLASAA